jgi:hypothetical protein
LENGKTGKYINVRQLMVPLKIREEADKITNALEIPHVSSVRSKAQDEKIRYGGGGWSQ